MVSRPPIHPYSQDNNQYECWCHWRAVVGIWGSQHSTGHGSLVSCFYIYILYTIGYIFKERHTQTGKKNYLPVVLPMSDSPHWKTRTLLLMTAAYFYHPMPYHSSCKLLFGQTLRMWYAWASVVVHLTFHVVPAGQPTCGSCRWWEGQCQGGIYWNLFACVLCVFWMATLKLYIYMAWVTTLQNGISLLFLSRYWSCPVASSILLYLCLQDQKCMVTEEGKAGDCECIYIYIY